MATRKTSNPSAFWDEASLAEYLGIKRQTLRLWRISGRNNLPFVRVGGAIRYRRDAVEQWLAERSGTSCAQVAAMA